MKRLALRIRMNLYRLISGVAIFGLLLLIAGCNRSPTRYAKPVADVCPSGWKVSADSTAIVLRRDAPVWIMGKVSNPPPEPGESIEQYFKKAGREIHYEIRLRFIPLLSKADYEKLRAARQQAAAQLKKGSSGRMEYTQRQIHYEACQVPAFFTNDYSIFMGRWTDGAGNLEFRLEPLFTDIYPPAAVSEIEALTKNLRRVFKPYEATSD